MMSRSHQEAIGMVFDDLGWFLMIFRNHVFFMILPDFSNPSEKLMIVKSNGAKHSPPGDSGVPDWSEGVPPVCRPGDPLIHVISGETSSTGSFLIWIIMIFNALSNGIHAISVRGREHVEVAHIF